MFIYITIIVMVQNPHTSDQEQQKQNWENRLNNLLYNRDTEKTFIDKVLDRQDFERLKELTQKDELTRSNLLEILYLLVAVAPKLVNYSEWDRYLIGKYISWLRDFVTKTEILLDYMNLIEKGEFSQKDINGVEQGITTKSKTYKILEKIRKYDEHNIKFLVDIALYLSSSTLGVGATAFDTLTKSRFEYFYPNMGQQGVNVPQHKNSGRGLKQLLGGK